MSMYVLSYTHTDEKRVPPPPSYLEGKTTDKKLPSHETAGHSFPEVLPWLHHSQTVQETNWEHYQTTESLQTSLGQEEGATC